MTKMFTLLCKLIVSFVNSFILFQSNRKEEANTASADSIHDRSIMLLLFAKAYRIVSNRVNRFAGLLRRTGGAQEALPDEYGIHQHPHNLSPVAAMQPVRVYTTTTPQTNRMKQVLLSAKSRALCIVILLMSVFAAQNGFAQQRTFSTPGSGTFNFTVPAGVTSITVEVWGGGGRGGSLNLDGVGGGGGGGAYSRSVISVTPGAVLSYNLFVGAGSTSNSSPGEDTWFQSATTIMAKGGGSAATNSATAGTGGQASSGFGTFKFSGGNGRAGNTAGTDYGGGGGSSAGTAANGNTATTQTGATAPTGGGAGGLGRSSSLGDGGGGVGATPGGGGGGAYRSGNQTQNGGNGGNGQIIISWTCPTYSLTGTTFTSPVCSATPATINLAASAANLPVGTYSVTYTGAGGSPATMNVTTAGTGSFTTSAISSNTTITITNLSSGAASGGTGNSNCNNNTTANNSTAIVVSTASSVTTQPASQAICLGLPVTFTVAANGNPAPTVKWQKFISGVWTDISGATNLTYTIGAVGAGDAGDYRAVFTNICGSTNTNTANLTINTAPAITGEPVAPAAVCSGKGIRTISVTATGTGLAYQWRKNGSPLSNDATYSGVTGSVLTITNPAMSENGASFDVEVSGTCTPPAISTAVVLTVNQTPAAPTFISAPAVTTYCNGSTVTGGYAFNTAPSGTIIHWTIPNAGLVSTNLATSGDNDIPQFDIVNLTQAATSALVTVTIEDLTTNCVSDPLTFTITANPSPAVLNNVPDQIFCDGQTATINFTGAITSFSWSKTGADVGIQVLNSTISGTVLQFVATNTDLTDRTATITVTPHYDNGSVACENGIAKTFVITVKAKPTTSVAGSQQTICLPNSATLAANTPDVGVGSWSVTSGPSTLLTQFSDVNNPAAVFTPAGGRGNYVLSWTISNSPCALSSSPVTIIVNELIDRTVSAAASSVCSGSGTNIIVQSSTPGVSYQLREGTNNIGTAVIGTGGNISLPTGPLTVDQTFNVLASVAVCGDLQMSVTPTITINPILPVSVSITSDDADNLICATTPVTFTATVVNGGATPSYQWRVNGVNAGSNSPTFTTSTLTNGQTVTCVVTSSELCTSGNPATSNGIATSVNAQPQVSSFPNVGVCSGNQAALTITTNAGTGPFSITYNPGGVTQTGIVSGQPFLTTNTYSSATTITLLSITDANGCTRTSANGFTDATANITMNAAGPSGTSLAISGATAVCPGQQSTVTLTSTTAALANSGPYNIHYTLGAPNATTSAVVSVTMSNQGNGTRLGTFTTPALANSGSTPITITGIQSGSGCITSVNVTGSITVNTPVPVSVSIASNDADNIICAGQSVTFTATPVNGGTTPSYQWRIGATNVGTNSPTFTTTALADGNVVTCILTSNIACASGSPATSNAIIPTVNPAPSGTLTATENSGTANDNFICHAENVTFTATTGFSNYNFKINGNSVQNGASSTYSTTSLTGSIPVTVDVTNSFGCTATFNTVTINVNPALTLSLLPSNSVICENNTVSFTATPGGGTVKQYLSATASITGGQLPAPGGGGNNIPNGGNSPLISTVTIAGAPSGAVIDNNTTIRVKLKITSPRSQDIDAYLVSGTTLANGATRAMLLTNDNPSPESGTTADFYLNMTLSNQASEAPVVVGAAVAPFGNIYRTTGNVNVNPVLTTGAGGAASGTACNGTNSNCYAGSIPPNSLTSGGGAPINGQWTLFIFDDNSGALNPSILNEWTLEVSYDGTHNTTITDNSTSGTINGVTYTTPSLLAINSPYTYTATTTDLLGCSDTTTATVTVNPVSVGGSVAGAHAICTGNGLGNDLVLSGHTGNVTGWERSTDPGFGTSTPINNLTTTLTAAEIGTLTATTYFRAIVQSGVCAPAFSDAAVITVNTAPTVSATAISIPAEPGVCNASVNLGGNVTVTSPITHTLEYFIGTTPITSTHVFTGSTVVTVRATNACGSNETTFTVTVTDNQDPTITAPATVSVNADAGLCSASSVALGTPATADNCGVASVSNNAPETFPVGSTTVTWTVTDVNGNTATATQTVTVTDNQNPTITAPANISVGPDAGLCSASSVALGTATTADNCGVASVSNNAPATFPAGSTTVTWTVTDVNGNTATATQTVTVTDDQNPTITAPATIAVNADAGACFATIASLGTPTTADNCGVASVSNNAPETFPVGTTTVTWTVTDAAGNTATATQTVTVTDNQNPVVVTKNITAYLDATGNASIVAADVNNGSSDNCGIATMSVSPNSFTCANVGANTVTLTVTDVNGNSATSTATVTVVDNVNPAITAPATIAVNADAGACFATIASLGTPATADNCGVASVSNNAPETFPVGSTTVTWTVTDVNGNTATATQTVTVTDNENPIVITKNATVYLDGTGNASVTAAEVNNESSDNCGIASISVSPNSFTCANVGANTVTLTVTDIHGNSATGTATVTIVDNVNPTITAPATVSVNAGAG